MNAVEPFEVREQRLRELAASRGMTFQMVRTNKWGTHLYWIAGVAGVVMELSPDGKSVTFAGDPEVFEDAGAFDTGFDVFFCSSMEEAEAYLRAPKT